MTYPAMHPTVRDILVYARRITGHELRYGAITSKSSRHIYTYVYHGCVDVNISILWIRHPSLVHAPGSPPHSLYSRQSILWHYVILRVKTGTATQYTGCYSSLASAAKCHRSRMLKRLDLPTRKKCDLTFCAAIG